MSSRNSRSSRIKSENTQLQIIQKKSEEIVAKLKQEQQDKESEIQRKEEILYKIVPEELKDRMRKKIKIDRKNRDKNYKSEIQKNLKGFINRAIKDSSGSSSGFTPIPNNTLFNLKEVSEKYYKDVKPSRKFPRKGGSSRHTRKKKRNSH